MSLKLIAFVICSVAYAILYDYCYNNIHKFPVRCSALSFTGSFVMAFVGTNLFTADVLFQSLYGVFLGTVVTLGFIIVGRRRKKF